MGNGTRTGWLPPSNPRTNNSDSNVGLLSRVGSFLPLSHEAPQSLNRPDETTTEPQFLVLRSWCGVATLTQVHSTRFGRLDSRLEERRKRTFLDCRFNDRTQVFFGLKLCTCIMAIEIPRISPPPSPSPRSSRSSSPNVIIDNARRLTILVLFLCADEEKKPFVWPDV